MKVYEVFHTQPQVFLDGGTPVQGYVIQARLLEFNEVVEIQARSLDATDIDKRIRELLEQRRKLRDLGQ